jgi:hypothetical protein
MANLKRRRPAPALDPIVRGAGSKTLKVRAGDFAAARIQWLADTYAGGNVSLWIRYAALSAPRRFLIAESKQARGKKKVPAKKGA